MNATGAYTFLSITKGKRTPKMTNLMKGFLKNNFGLCFAMVRCVFYCFTELSQNFRCSVMMAFTIYLDLVQCDIELIFVYNKLLYFVLAMSKNREKKHRSSPLTVHTKEIISKLFDFITKLQTNEIYINSFISDVKTRETIAKICNVSARSIYRVLKERDNPGSIESVDSEVDTEIEDNVEDNIPRKRKAFNSPKKRGPKSKRKIDFDDQTKDCIRHMIYDFHLTEQRTVTIAGLKEKINKDLNLNLGSTSLRAVIRSLGAKQKIIGRY